MRVVNETEAAETVCRFRPDEAKPAGAEGAYSLHRGNVLECLKLAEALGMCPKEVVLVGIQLGSLSPGKKLSQAVEAAIPEAVALTLAEVTFTPPGRAVYCCMNNEATSGRLDAMRLSRKSEYACLAMIDLAEHHRGKPVNMTDLARRTAIPKKYLEQILLILKRAGHVRSTRGPGGGYQLAKPPRRISLAEIIRLLDGPLAPVESVSKYFYEHTPVEANKRLTRVFKEIRDYAAKKLEHTYLSDFL